jgi:adenylate cyclase
MGRDDSATLEGLKTHRRELIDPKIAEYGGRIVKTTGDGLLLEFPSVVDAVRCAVDIQRGMAERNADVAPDHRIAFRIGINVGDIIIDGDDIFGDGVNVAARLQTLAEPGGICVSRVVRDQVLDKLSFTFEDLGPQDVKNIARPVEAYRVDLGTGALQTPNRVHKRWQRLTQVLKRQWLATGIVGLALVAVVALMLLPFWRSAPVPTSPPLSVGILPFTTPKDSPAEEQFADALTQDLTTVLGRWRWAKVAGQRTMEGYKGKTIEARTVGRQAGFRYLLEGQVRPASNKLIVTAHLIDVDAGADVWNDQLEFGAADKGVRQQVQLEQHMRRGLYAAEMNRAARETTSRLPMDLVLRGDVTGRNNWTLPQALEQRKFYEQALQLDADFVPALVRLSQSFGRELVENPAVDRVQASRKMDKLTSRAIAIDPMDSKAWGARTDALEELGRWDEALSANARAQALESSNSSFVLERAFIMIHTGQPGEALTMAEQALAMDPTREEWPLHYICHSNLFLGRYDDAVATCARAAALNNWWLNQLYLCAAYAQTGDLSKAALAKAALLEQQPSYKISRYQDAYPSSRPAFFELTNKHLATGLRIAGLSEN